jgi:hypothetical protein
VIFGPDDLRAIAECDARAGEPLGKALRWAADEIDRLRDLVAMMDHSFHPLDCPNGPTA